MWCCWCRLEEPLEKRSASMFESKLVKGELSVVFSDWLLVFDVTALLGTCCCTCNCSCHQSLVRKEVEVAGVLAMASL